MTPSSPTVVVRRNLAWVPYIVCSTLRCETIGVLCDWSRLAPLRSVDSPSKLSSSCQVVPRWAQLCRTAPSICSGQHTGMCDCSRSSSPFCSMIVWSIGTNRIPCRRNQRAWLQSHTHGLLLPKESAHPCRGPSQCNRTWSYKPTATAHASERTTLPDRGPQHNWHKLPVQDLGWTLRWQTWSLSREKRSHPVSMRLSQQPWSTDHTEEGDPMAQLVWRWSCQRWQTAGGGSNPCWSTRESQVRPAERQREPTTKKKRPYRRQLTAAHTFVDRWRSSTLASLHQCCRASDYTAACTARVNGCSLWSRGSWLGGSLVSALSCVAFHPLTWPVFVFLCVFSVLLLFRWPFSK